jgi:hypothetical protein
MHIRTKFDGGKVYNLCNRGSWHACRAFFVVLALIVVIFFFQRMCCTFGFDLCFKEFFNV